MYVADGKVIPTELQREAGELRKKMKYDDNERESKNTRRQYYKMVLF